MTLCNKIGLDFRNFSIGRVGFTSFDEPPHKGSVAFVALQDSYVVAQDGTKTSEQGRDHPVEQLRISTHIQQVLDRPLAFLDQSP